MNTITKGRNIILSKHELRRKQEYDERANQKRKETLDMPEQPSGWNRIIVAMRRDLVDFGYASLTFEQTEQALIQALEATSKDDIAGNIIAMFIYGWLEDEYKSFKPILMQLNTKRKEETEMATLHKLAHRVKNRLIEKYPEVKLADIDPILKHPENAKTEFDKAVIEVVNAIKAEDASAGKSELVAVDEASQLETSKAEPEPPFALPKELEQTTKPVKEKKPRQRLKISNFDLVSSGACPHEKQPNNYLGVEVAGKGDGITRLCSACAHKWYLNRTIHTCKCLTCSAGVQAEKRKANK